MNPNLSILTALDAAEKHAPQTGVEVEETQSAPGISVYPATVEQSRYWALDQLEGDSRALRMVLVWSLEGKVDDLLAQQAMTLLTDRHSSLRTVFKAERTALQQVVLQPSTSTGAGFSLKVTDLRGRPQAEQQRAVDAAARGASPLQAGRIPDTPHEPNLNLKPATALEPAMDLAHGPLFAAELIHLSNDRHLLVLALHKIICDDWSAGILLQDFAEIYDALLTRRAPQLEELACQFADVAVWQQGWLHGHAAQDAREFWRSSAERNFAAADLPLDRQRTATSTGLAGTRLMMFPGPLAAQLKEFVVRHQQTLQTVVLAAFEALLSRYTGQKEFLLGSAVNRRAPGTQHIVGRFSEARLLLADMNGDPTFIELMARVQGWDSSSSPYQQLPFSQVLEEFQCGRAAGSASALTHVYFNPQTVVVEARQTTGLRIIPCPTVLSSVDFDLAVSLIESEEEPGLRIEYNADLQSDARVEGLLQLFLGWLGAIIADPGLRLSQLPLLTVEHQAALEDAANGGPAEIDLFRPTALVDVIQAHAHRHPYDTAVVAGNRELSWEILIKQSREYAAALKTRGVRKGTLVAVRMEPRIETAICCLALLMLRAVVVPVPVSADAQVWEALKKTVSPELAIAAKGYLRPSWTTWNFEALAASYIKPCDLSPADPEDVACVVLSSSAEAEMVAVPVDHQTAVSVFRGTAQTIKLGEGDVLQVLSATGSVEAWSDLMMALCAGARAVLLSSPEQLQPDSPGLRARGRFLIGSYAELSALSTTATAATTLLYRERRTADARHHLAAAKGTQDHSQRCALLYACAAGGPVAMTRMEDSTVIRLMPVAGCRLKLEDAFGHWPAPGADGALFVAVANAGTRLVDAGWICRQEADGALTLREATQRRVHLNGNRVCLTELEDALLSQPNIADAAAVVQSDEHQQATLHAYLILRQQEFQKLQTLREALRQRLPEWLASTELHLVGEFPRRADGTVDGERLKPSILAVASAKVPGSTRVPGYPTALVPALAPQRQVAAVPKDEIEQTIAQIWERTLGVRSISRTVSFFELGSYQPILPRLFERMNQALGTKLPSTAIFNAPTIAGLADIVRGKTRLTTLVPVQIKGTRSPLFVLHSYALYGTLPGVLGGDQPVYGLQELQEDSFDSMESRIAHYVSEIRRVQLQGPYNLAGREEAGMLVAEAARQFKRAGDEVGQVILFDSSNHKPGGAPSSTGSTDANKSNPDAEKKSVMFRSRTLLLKVSNKYNLHLPELKQKVSSPASGGILMNPQQFDGSITLIRGTGSQGHSGDSPACGWENVARGGVDVLWVSGNRESMFTGEALKNVGRLVTSRLQGQPSRR